MAKRTCDVPECERPTVGRGLCRMHYQRMRKHGTTDLVKPLKPAPQPCTVEGCDGTRLARGLCGKHYQRLQNKGNVEDSAPRSRSACTADSCTKESVGRGLCAKHYRRFMHHGTTERLVRQPSTCSVDGCERVNSAKGLCGLHLRRRRKGADLAAPLRTPRQGCTEPGCPEPHHCRELCKRHYVQRYVAPKRAQYQQTRHDRVAAMSPAERAEEAAKRRRYYQENRERIQSQRKAAYTKMYAQDPAPWRAAKSRRRMRLDRRMTPDDARISVDYRRAIAADPCYYCGAEETDCVDHIFPLAKGGTDHWWNLARACTACNASKHSKCSTRYMLLAGLL